MSFTPQGCQQQRVPATRIPATRVPATRVPATRVPATRVPATRIPATRIPATRVPATRVPATRVPATRVPATRVPATRVPAYRTRQATSNNIQLVKIGRCSEDLHSCCSVSYTLQITYTWDSLRYLYRWYRYLRVHWYLH